jgi:hypothetical protein
MKRPLLAGVVGLVFLVSMTSTAPAKVVLAPPPIAVRVALSEVVVVGKVTSIEEKAVSAPRFPGDNDGGEYKIAVVKVENALVGAEGLTHVKAGFLAPRGVGPSLVKDQEVCLFLKPHFRAPFLAVNGYHDSINKKGNADFDKEVAEAKRCAKLLADPKAGLASRSAEDRYLTTAMLLMRYNTPKDPANPNPKKEPIDAAESKAILLALADADWTNRNSAMFYVNSQDSTLFRFNPLNLFFQMNLTDKDGWNPPTIEVDGNKQIDYKALPEAARKWLKDNAGTYRLQRFVEEKKEEKKDDK